MKNVLLAIFIVLFCATAILAQDTPLAERDTMTDGMFGLYDALAEEGIEFGISMTNVYQQNLRGGLGTRFKSGRYTGSYDIEMGIDLERLWDLQGASIFMLAEGSWPAEEGINDYSVGSFQGTNDDAGGNRAIDITELWFQQVFDGGLTVKIGKVDLTGTFECRGCPSSFDGNAYANDETAQFLNTSMVNNPTIPFPDNGLGIVLYYNPADLWYTSFGAADAQADARETGFSTTFGDEDYFFYIAEAGVTPVMDSANGEMPGAYRCGVWYDPQEKEKLADSSKIVRDDVGFYISADQMVSKENDGEEDTQGLGLFARYGFAHSNVNEVTNFWSVGMQYQGLVDGRDDDVLGIGAANAIFSDDAGIGNDSETIMEMYYNVAVYPWFNVTPSIQYVSNISGDTATYPNISDAVVFGVRIQATF